MNENIVAVVVTYNSPIERLTESLSVLADQCTVVVVDNSTQSTSREEIRLICDQIGVFWLSLGGNFGIAHAQNIGIAWARKRNAIDIILIDDDSIPSKSFLEEMLEARKTSRIHPVVVSARTISEDGKDISNRAPEEATGLTPCSELTSSGTIIPMVVFDRVGFFDERLFIDCVDFEWGWRARALGVPLLLCDGVTIQHRLGENTRLGFRLPSPVRHYYQYRNILITIFQSKAPLRWRFSQLVKLPVKLMLITLFADHRTHRLRYAAYGIRDFFSGRIGKFNH